MQEFEHVALELMTGHHTALVFSQFTDLLKLLAWRLGFAGMTCQYLDGSTRAAERDVGFQRGNWRVKRLQPSRTPGVLTSALASQSRQARSSL